MPQHVRMHRKRKLRLLRYPCDQLPKPRRRHRRQALRHKHIPTFHLLTFQPAQRSYLSPTDRMDARRPVLDPPHVEQSPTEIDLLPTQRAQLRRAQPMPVRYKDHCRIAMTVAPAIARGVDQPLDFLDCEIFALPALAVWRQPPGYCPV